MFASDRSLGGNLVEDAVGRFLSSILALVCLMGCAHAPALQGDVVRRDVTELIQRWSDAGESGDWDFVASTYAEHPAFTWIEQGEARYRSRAAIVAGLARARSMSASIRNDVSNVSVTPLANDVAAFTADYFLSVSAEGFSYTSQGVWSGVAIRQGDGWRFLQGSFSERPTPVDR